jgi:hypothetical protein
MSFETTAGDAPVRGGVNISELGGGRRQQQIQEQQQRHRKRSEDNIDLKLQELGDVDDRIIRDANAEVRKLAEETAVAAEIFADVAQQTYEQGEALDSVEDHLESADDAVMGGVSDLQKVRCCGCCSCLNCFINCC